PYKKIVRSVSKYAIADITLDFEDGTDIYWARQQVAERLAAVTRDLPAGVAGGLAPITTPLGEMFMFTVEGPLSLDEKRTLIDWTIRPALRTLPGVADVNVLGGRVRAFEVVPDHAALAARGVTMAELAAALQENNRNDGAGRVRDGEETLVVRAEGAVRTLDDLKAIVVASRDAKPVRIGDLATVRVGSLTRYGAVTQDGKSEAVEGLVLGLRGANAKQVVEGVRERLASLKLPPGVTTSVFYDRGGLVSRAVSTVARALGEAIVLVLVLLVLFLGDLRAALAVALMLPLSALATFILMRQFGMSANLMSLGGLAIAIGMLVDAGVVVVENVVTHLAQEGKRGLPRLNIIYRAVSEVTLPVTSGVAIIVIIFLPLLTLQGLEGKLFIPVALSIVFALSASLVLSLTLVPVLTSFLLKEGGHGEPWLVRQVMRAYAPVLRWSLAHARIVVAAALVALVGAAAAYLAIGKTFMPTLDEGDLIIGLEKLPSISIDASAETDLALQRAILSSVPEVTRIVARMGSDELGLDPMGLNQSDTFLVLEPKDEWRRPDKDWLMDELRAVLARFPGVAYSFTQPIEMRVSEMLSGVRGDVAIKIFGPDLATLNSLAGRYVDALKTLRGAEDVFTVKNEGVQYLSVSIDRLAAGRLGLSVDEVQDALRSHIEGQVVGVVLEAGRRTPLLLRGEERVRDAASVLRGVTLSLPSAPGGQGVPLAELARLERVDGPVKIDHENAARMVVVQANVRGRDLVGFVDEAKQAVAAKAPLPAGYRAAWGGQFENQQRAAARLGIVVPVALALIFILLFATFRSLRQAILVFANVPFALIGGVAALLVTGHYLSVPASVGFIALIGVAVLNGVVMVSYFNQLHDLGLPIDEVVQEGAKRRLRPVLMTASIAAFGLVPLVTATGPGSEIQRPLAIVVIGGLASATLLTLVLLPLLYRRFGLEPIKEVRE
ncbi:MAG TPA: CusA/CzcA family heavy metal efflux RND transporter, partial [Burkholderiales bacterium]|nr:CusA/CzcA family heavy metal efflux RND transporter [Burkholderiales bacterium]